MVTRAPHRFRLRACGVLIAAVIVQGCQEQPAAKPLADEGSPGAEKGSALADPEPESVGTTQATRSGAEADSDEGRRTLILGTWEDDYKGHRIFTLRADGTATMVVELEGAAATLYAARMRFDEEWSINAGRLKLKTVGGEPRNRVDLITKMMGSTANQRILELTPDRMVLEDEDGATRYEWRRVR